MRNWLLKFQPTPWLLNKLVILALLVAVGAGSFYWGRRTTSTKKADNKIAQLLDGIPTSSSSYGGRVVAYVWDLPVYREEFGEYLISRLGKDRLEFMVNRKIVETECRRANISASDADVEARLDDDLWNFGGGKTKLSVKDFETNFLQRFGKTLFEWKEDVIRPKIMMERLVRSQVKVKDEDLRQGFEARFGPQVECRMIVLLEKDMSIAQKVWEHARKGTEAFLEEARKQAIPQLASAEGKVPPIHRHLGDKDLEDAAFRMTPGEISGLLKMKDGSCVILLCEKKVGANTIARFEDERVKIHREVEQARVQQLIPQVLAEFRAKANPRLVLDNRGAPSSDIIPASFSQMHSTQFNPRPVAVEPGKGAPLPPDTPLPAPKDVKKPAEIK